MAEVFIYWWEIDEGNFPDCCLTCGADDTELVPRRLETYHIGFMCRYRRYITVDLPFCPIHERRPWIRWGRTDASSFTDEGVWIKNVSPLFVEEMEIFRDEEEREETRHRKRTKRRRRDDDFDDREPFADRRRREARPDSTASTLILTLTACLVPVAVVGLCCVGGLLLPMGMGGARPNPGIRQQQPRPNFNIPPPPKVNFPPPGRGPAWR